MVLLCEEHQGKGLFHAESGGFCWRCGADCGLPHYTTPGRDESKSVLRRLAVQAPDKLVEMLCSRSAQLADTQRERERLRDALLEAREEAAAHRATTLKVAEAAKEERLRLEAEIERLRARLDRVETAARNLVDADRSGWVADLPPVVATAWDALCDALVGEGR